MNNALKATGDRKTKFWAGQKNTFGLLPGRDGTCPMATLGQGGCSHIAKGRKNPDCYVYNIMSAYPGVRAVLEHNTRLLQNASNPEKIRLLTAEFKRFREAELRRPEPKLFYRLHWSGDIFNSAYACALSIAMNEFPDITFWAYTRTLNIVTVLANVVPNLTLYISLDPINLYEGLSTYYHWLNSAPKYNNVQLCYMSHADDFAINYQQAYWHHQFAITVARLSDKTPETEWPSTPPKLRGCPVDSGRLKMDMGCSRCLQCVNKRDGWKPSPVWFES